MRRGPLPKPRWRLVIFGYLFAFAAGWAYGAGIRAGTGWGTGEHWERELLLTTHRDPHPVIDAVLNFIPWLGTNLTLGPIAGIVALLCWWKGRRDLAVWIAVVELGCLSQNYLLKQLLERDRPDVVERVGWFGWASYPSGHAMAAVAVLLTFAVALLREKGWRWPLAVAIPIPALIAYSRMYHGVHWPTDIVGGALVGVVWLGTTLLGFGVIERRRGLRGRRASDGALPAGVPPRDDDPDR